MDNPDSDAAFLNQVTSRIVRMFELFVKNINPDDPAFKTFIANYVAKRGMKDLETTQYSELYKVIKGGIREYMNLQQPKKAQK